MSHKTIENCLSGVKAIQSVLSDLKSRINDLEQELNYLKQDIIGEGTSSIVGKPNEEQSEKLDERQLELSESSKTFFLSTPDPDGSFFENSASSSYKEGASIYRFTRIGEKKAEFQINESENSVKLALYFPDIRIEPCCISINTYNSKTKRIVTLKKGIVELSGDKWIIETKAEISYEN